MTNRWTLVAAPFGAAAVFFVLFVLLPPSERDQGFYYFEHSVAFGAATLGCALAAFSFGRGDYLRRAWLLVGTCNGLLLLDQPLLFAAKRGLVSTGLSEPVSATVTALANASTVVGLILVARAWSVAGLDLQVSPVIRRAAVLGSVALGVLVAGPSALRDLRLFTQGDMPALSTFISDVGDVTALAVLAPLLLTARALRGGTLFWPWAMLAFSSVSWILFDASLEVSHWLHLERAAARPGQEAIRVLACFAALSAGMLQRAVLRSPAPRT